MLGGTAKAAADAAHARLVFASGQSFDLGRNPLYLDVLEQARKSPTWRPKGREAVGSTDLFREYDRVEASSKENIQELEPVKFGKTLTTDGWTGKDNIPRVNIIESVCGIERFLDAIDCSGEFKNRSFLADLLTLHMTPFVDLVVADGSCEGMLSVLEAKYPWLTGMKCAAHAIDLLLKDIVKAEWAASIIKRNIEVVKYINDNPILSALYLTKTKRKLITPRTMRFPTNLISASRTLQDNIALRNLANDPALEELLTNATPAIRAIGKRVKRELLSSDDYEGDFWFEMSFFIETSTPCLTLSTPCLTLLRMADGTKPCMSKFFYGFLTLPDKWDEIRREQAAACDSAEGGGWANPATFARLDVMKEKCQLRREDAWCPLMSAAFATDPEFIRPSINLASIDNDRVLMDLNTMYERLLIEYEPGEDSAAAAARVAATAAEPDGGPVGRARAAMSLFRKKDWQGAMYLGAAKHMPVAEWWDVYGCTGMEELAKVGMRCNSKIPASAGPDRSRSLCGDVMGGRHAAMGVDKARKVVFVRANLKLQTETFSRRPFVAWDPESVESDGFLGSGDDMLDSGSHSDGLGVW